MASWRTSSEAETRQVGADLAALLPRDAVLLVSGDLGAGKTVLAQGVAAGLELDPREVVSPTYTLIHEHGEGRHRFVHVDLYRLAPEQVPPLGVEELLAGPGLKFVEWGERLPFPVEEAFRAEVRRVSAGDPQAREIDLWEGKGQSDGETADP